MNNEEAFAPLQRPSGASKEAKPPGSDPNGTGSFAPSISCDTPPMAWSQGVPGPQTNGKKETRSVTVSAKLTTTEKEWLDAKVKASGLEPYEYARMMLLHEHGLEPYEYARMMLCTKNQPDPSLIAVLAEIRALRALVLGLQVQAVIGVKMTPELLKQIKHDADSTKYQKAELAVEQLLEAIRQ